MKITQKIKLAFFLLTILVAGCQRPPPITEISPTTQGWQLNSRFNILTHPKQGKTESISGKLTWQQNKEIYNIKLTSILGQTIAMIHGNDKAMTLHTRNGDSYDGDPYHLMQQTLGWQMPIPELRRWLIGQPSNNSTSTKYNTAGSIKSFIHNDWLVTYKQRQSEQRKALPTKMQLANTELTIRLFAMSWQQNKN